MPRGSKPGERRGGRQRGTPNKKTLLKNAVFCAAAAEPNRSPLDFMLALMRDPQVPLEDRIDMAAAATPFVHAKPKAPSRVRTNPMDSSPLKSGPVCAPEKQEGESGGPKMAPEQPSDGGTDISPLKFLIGVMNDSEATPKQRIRAARTAARYKHAQQQPDKLAAVDEYGFSISRTLAKAIADDWLWLEFLEGHYANRNEAKEAQEALQIYARQAERDRFLQCPAGYSDEQDFKRRSELLAKRRNGLSMAEETELAFVIARITASEAAYYRTPEGRARRRFRELRARMRAAGGANPEPGSTPEKRELEQLLKEFPAVAVDRDARQIAPFPLPSGPIIEHLKRMMRMQEERKNAHMSTDASAASGSSNTESSSSTRK